MPEQAVYLAFLAALSVVNSIGQIVMRWGGAQRLGPHRLPAGWAAEHYPWLWNSRWWLVGILLTWVCGIGWAWCLRKMPLATAVPLYSGLVYVLSVLGGACFLKERMSGVQAIGVATILVGVILVTCASVSAGRAPSRP